MNTEPITPEAVAELLRTAGAPARPGELHGEADALAAFRAVHRPVTQTRSVPFMNRLTRVLTVKAAAVTIAVTGMGGVALAAGSGALPVPADTPVVGSEAKAAKKAKKEKAAHEQKVRDWSGLCTAATEGNALRNPGKAAQNPAFGGLINAAGGAEFVPAFCDGVLGTVPPVVENPPAEAPVEAPVELPGDQPVTEAAEETSPGKSGSAGKENAPGQNKVEGQPATGKGQATAPGLNKPEGTPAADNGKASAPGQNKADAGPATGKGKAGAPGQNKSDRGPADEEAPASS